MGVLNANNNATLSGNNRMLKEAELIRKTGCSRSTIRRWVDNGTFPKPYKLGERAVGWLMSEVDEWLNSRRVA